MTKRTLPAITDEQAEAAIAYGLMRVVCFELARVSARRDDIGAFLDNVHRGTVNVLNEFVRDHPDTKWASAAQSMLAVLEKEIAELREDAGLYGSAHHATLRGTLCRK